MSRLDLMKAMADQTQAQTVEYFEHHLKCKWLTIEAQVEEIVNRGNEVEAQIGYTEWTDDGALWTNLHFELAHAPRLIALKPKASIIAQGQITDLMTIGRRHHRMTLTKCELLERSASNTADSQP